MKEYLKRIFGKLTLLEIATAELAEAERSKLQAQSSQEFAASVVSYNDARIKRLRNQINSLTVTKATSPKLETTE